MGEGLADDTAPPAYASTVDPEPISGGNTGTPPAYDSLYGKLKDTRAESSGSLDFVQKVTKIVFETYACTIVSIVVLCLHIAMLIIGAIYLDDCPFQRFIPIYLIVAGCFGIVRTLCCAYKGKQMKEETGANEKDYGAIIDVFLFAWLICGSWWVYRNNGEVDYVNTGDSNYCQPTVYKFAFGILATYWSLLSLFVCCIFCACCFAIAIDDDYS